VKKPIFVNREYTAGTLPGVMVGGAMVTVAAAWAAYVST